MSNRLQLNLEHGTNIACAPFAMISTQRGFRQATRGPDTGAFHHPLFRRDQPHLCLDMVCQRSRNSSKQPKNKQMSGNLSIAPLTKESLDTILPSAASQQTQPPNSRVATVSVSDDTGSSDTGTAESSHVARAPTIKHGISSDKGFVQKVLKDHEEMERLRIAKVMLYRAYVEALQGAGH